MRLAASRLKLAVRLPYSRVAEMLHLHRLAPSLTAALPGTGVAGGGGGLPVSGLSYASMVGGWVGATLCFAARAPKCKSLRYMGAQVSYSMMSFWLFLAWAGCEPLSASSSRLSAPADVY